MFTLTKAEISRRASEFADAMGSPTAAPTGFN
jgi:hypothetical protein